MSASGHISPSHTVKGRAPRDGEDTTELFNEEFDADQAPSLVDQRPLGQVLVDLGFMESKDIETVLRLQRRRGMRFGEAAHKLRLVNKRHLQQALAIQFGYPCLQAGDTLLSEELVTAYRPFSLQGEAMRDLRSQLLLRCFSTDNTVLAIVSPYPRDGRSFAVGNLAVAFAQWGRKTLLIDADLRSPRQHLIFNVDNRTGLSSVLRGAASRDAIRKVPYFGNLNVLPAGTTPPNPLELFGRSEFLQLLTEAQDAYDVVLIDTPAACNCADAQVIAAQAGSALMIAREDVSRLDDLEELLDRLSGSGVQVMGAALNRY
jgi:receptor protein-tyrosine kinase